MKTLGTAMLAAMTIIAPPAWAQAVTASAEDSLPPRRPVPKPPVPYDQIGKPRFRGGPAADYPDAARMAGQHGRVVVSGMVTVDGIFSAPTITTSSRSALLDAAALTAARAAIFFPARDANGEAIAAPASREFEFFDYRSDGPGRSLQSYTCRAFVRDMDWWHATWSDTGYKDNALFNQKLGLGILVRMRSGRFDHAAFTQYLSEFEKQWEVGIDACRTRPDALFVDVIKPLDDYLKAPGVQRQRDGKAGG